MRAFVLSGGGNRGAIQVGALQVLLERGFKPDLLIGTSAGALNAAFLATDPTLAGVRRLEKLCESVKQADVYPGSRWSVLWRLVHNAESLYSNTNFQCFLERQLDALHVRFFGDIPSKVRLYVVAARLDTGVEYVFGDSPHDRLLDALMASTAFPPFHPPWRCNGNVYVDGGVTSELPIRIALERGADEIIALQVNGPNTVTAKSQPLFTVIDRALSILIQQQYQHELQVASECPGVKLSYIPLTTHLDVPLWDFWHSAEMIAEGRAALEASIDALLDPHEAHDSTLRYAAGEPS